MLRVLYSDLRRTIWNKTVALEFLGVALYPLFFWGLLTLVTNLAGFDQAVYGEDFTRLYIDISAFIIAAVVTGIMIPDHADGLIRNKISTGTRRIHAFNSSMIVSAALAVSLAIVSSLSSLIITAFLTPGFIDMTYDEAVIQAVVMLFPQIAVAVLSAGIIMTVKDGKVAVVIPLALAFIFKVLGTYITQKLYPDSGVTTLTGLRLFLFTAYDRFFPYAHLSGPMRWDTGSYVIGSLTLMAITYIVCLFIFERKDIA